MSWQLIETPTLCKPWIQHEFVVSDELGRMLSVTTWFEHTPHDPLHPLPVRDGYILGNR